MNSIKVTAALLLIVIFLSFSLIDASAKDFTDEMNRSVVLKKFPPKRIVSLSPSVTEILFELGLDHEIVGVTRECNFPPAAKEKAKVSKYTSINMELLVSIKPDLIIVSAEGNLKEQFTKMERLGLTVYAVHTKSLDDIQRTIVNIGSVVGKDIEAKALAAKVKAKINAVRERLKGVKKKSVFCAVGFNPIVGVGPNTLIGDVIRVSGGENILAADGPDYPMINIEELYVKDPDVLLISSMGSEVVSGPDDSFLSKFADLTAAKTGNIFVIDSNILCRPSYRITDALTDIAKKLYPDRMGAKD